MVKKISLDLPDDNYEELASLGEFYNKDVKQVISVILHEICQKSSSIITLGKDYKGDLKLGQIMFFILSTGVEAIQLIFNNVLEKMGVKGLYLVDDFGYNLEKHDLWLHCVGFERSNLAVDAFHIHLKSDSGGPTLETYSYIEIEKINSEKLEKLKKLIEQVDLPVEFCDIDNIDLIIDENEERVTLQINLEAESLDDLPSLKVISRLISKSLGKLK